MPRKPNPFQRRCGAKTKAGTPCRQWAVRGRTRCRMHGGGSPGRERRGERKRPGRPPTHGAYSEQARRDLRQAMEDFREDPDVGQIEGEIAYLKLRLQALTGKAEGPDDDAVLTDPQGGDKGRVLCESIALLVEKRHRMIHGDKYLVSIALVEPILKAFDEVIDEQISDPDAREGIREALERRLAGILLPVAPGV